MKMFVYNLYIVIEI